MANTISSIKLSGITYQLIDSTAIHSLDGYSTTEQMNAAITAATNVLSNAIEKNTNDIATVSGNVATVSGNVATVSGDVATLKTDVANKFGYVTYDKQAQKIYFKDAENGKNLGEVGVEDFVKDAFVESVEIEDGYLVITWNSDAELEPTKIALTDIFNPDNYYTKSQTDSKIEEAIEAAGAITPEGVDEKIDAAKEELEAEIEKKQDKLVSGTNIKTVGGQTLLGAGNVALMTAKVEGDVLEFEFA